MGKAGVGVGGEGSGLCKGRQDRGGAKEEGGPAEEGLGLGRDKTWAEPASGRTDSGQDQRGVVGNPGA